MKTLEDLRVELEEKIEEMYNCYLPLEMGVDEGELRCYIVLDQMEEEDFELFEKTMKKIYGEEIDVDNDILPVIKKLIPNFSVPDTIIEVEEAKEALALFMGTPSCMFVPVYEKGYFDQINKMVYEVIRENDNKEIAKRLNDFFNCWIDEGIEDIPFSLPIKEDDLYDIDIFNYLNLTSEINNMLIFEIGDGSSLYEKK